MYFSLYHWRPLVNGYSGYRPAPARDVQERARALPSLESVQYLRAIGVRQLLIHAGARLHALLPQLGAAVPGTSAERFPSGAVILTWPDGARGGELSAHFLFPSRVRPAGPADLGVLFANSSASYWINPDQRACAVTVAWRGDGDRAH